MTAVAGAVESPWSVLVADDEIIADLQALGVRGADVSAAELDQTRRDAVASVFLRRHAEEIAHRAQLEESRDAEIEFIRARYADQMMRSSQRIITLDRAVQAIAAQTRDAGGYVGKKKSRDVGAGTFGYRSYAADIDIIDDAAYLAWAESNAPESVRVALKLTLAEARQYFAVDELRDCKREVVKATAKTVAEHAPELPPGCQKTPAEDVFYANPLPAAAIAGARS